MTDRYLVTGAHGCIGAWVVHELVAQSAAIIALDVSADASRLALLLDSEALSQLAFVEASVTDPAAVERIVAQHGITNVIHLAALQIPFCRARPAEGAAVNVGGTVNIFEAARKRSDTVRSVVYASSIAAYDALDAGVSPNVMADQPSTLYGVFKRANEGIAAVYAREFGVGSVGLRPHTVYGVGRDQGLTSAPTHAMLCAAAGSAFEIPFGGSVQFQYALDVARWFIGASRAAGGGAVVHDLPGRSTSVEEIVAAIMRAAPSSSISYVDKPLPFPSTLGDASELAALVGPLSLTPLDEGVRETVARFRDLLSDGRLDAPR